MGSLTTVAPAFCVTELEPPLVLAAQGALIQRTFGLMRDGRRLDKRRNNARTPRDVD
jgi:hypothetical protein